MTTTLKAIETRYKGYRFRSRLEARWAVFFDELQLRYEYEKEAFDLGDGVRYLPDFWMPDGSMWIEVKPTAPTADEVEKAQRLAAASGAPVIVLIGTPEQPDGWLGRGRHHSYQPDGMGRNDLTWLTCRQCRRGFGITLGPVRAVCPEHGRRMATDSVMLNLAYDAARGARFDRREAGD